MTSSFCHPAGYFPNFIEDETELSEINSDDEPNKGIIFD